MTEPSNSFCTEGEAKELLDGPFDIPSQEFLGLASNDLEKYFPEKPMCVGCGYCCMSQPCWLAFIGEWWKDGQCELIVWDGKRYLCALVSLCADMQFAHMPESLLGIDTGCDGEDGHAPWRSDVRERSQAEARAVRELAEYEDGPVNALLDRVCGLNESFRDVIIEFVNTITSLMSNNMRETHHERYSRRINFR